MSYNIKGEVQTTGTMIIQGKSPGLNIKLTGNGLTYTPDIDGKINLPIKMQDDIDDIFSKIPLSQYGAINNNTPGVSGTFDGGSTVSYYSAMPVLLEQDGSLVYLRPGTNGSSINYYYTYINNPSSSMQPFTTIKKYYEGSWNNILFADTDAKTCLLYEEVANNIIHLVLTNGTMNKENHQSATISRSSIPYYIMTATVVDTYMYIVCLYASGFDINNPTSVKYSSNDPFQFILYRIPISEIQTGAVNTVEKIDGITGNTLYGSSQGSQSYIRITDIWDSSSGGNSFIRWQPSFSQVAGYTYSIPGMCKSIFDGTNLIFNITTNCYFTNNTYRYDTMYSFRVIYNVNTKVFTTDLITGMPIVANGSTTGTITFNNPYEVTSSNLYGMGTAQTDGLHGTWYITENGTQYYINEKYVLNDFYPIYSAKIANFTTKFDAYNIRGRTFTDTVTYNVKPDFASRVGDQLMGGIPISSNHLIFNGTGTYLGSPFSKYRKGVADIGISRTYSYNSFSNGTINGYAPQIYRQPLPSSTETFTYNGISYCDISGNVTFYGTMFIEDTMLVAGYLLNTDTLTYDKTISIDNIMLKNLKNNIISSVGLSVSSSKIALYYSPDTSYFESLACVTTINSGGGGNIILASVSCTENGITITSANLINIINNFNDVNFVSIEPNGTSFSETIRHGGMCVVKYSDFTYVSLPHAINVYVPGDSEEFTYCGIKSGNTLTSLILSRSYHAPDIFTTARDYSYIPNYGFGYYMFEKTDKGTKLIFKCCGNTLSEYNNNMLSGTGVETVILAQDVIQGFYLYFTEVTPILMNGKYHEMPITTIDLSTIQDNPGNTIFYVYIDSNMDTPVYKVSTTKIPESLTIMYIGNIQTDGTKVASLNINKVSRFNIYRPSSTQIGSAFPVSTGYPVQYGSISW